MSELKPFNGTLDEPTESTGLKPFDGALDGEKTSAMRKMADLGVGFASGAVGATKALTDAAGAGNKASTALSTLNTGLTDYLSPQAKADQQEQGRIMADASGQGVWEGVKAGAKAFAVAPVQTAVQGLGSVVPIVAGTALTGGAAPAAAVGAGLGVAMGAGTAKGAIYDEIKKRGGTDEEAVQAQAYGGANSDQIALGGALGAVDALTGVSKAASGMVRGALGKPVMQAAKNAAERGIVGRAGMGMLGEIPLEAAQGGQEQVAANLAAQRAGYEAGTWDNVASNATLEALASAGPGAAFGAAGKGPTAKPVAQPTGEVAPGPDLALDPSTQLSTVQSEEMGAPNVPQATPPDGRAVLNAQQAQQQLEREAQLAAQRAEASPDDEIFASTGALDPVKPSQAMGIKADAGPLSRVAAGAVDGGMYDEIQQDQATEQDQAAYDAYMAQQEAEAQQQDTANQAITQGPLAEARMSEEDKRAVLFSNKVVSDGGRQYEGTQDGDILNGMSAPFATRFAAARRAKLEGAGWTIAPVFDGFVARRKDAFKETGNGTTDRVLPTPTNGGGQDGNFSADGVDAGEAGSGMGRVGQSGEYTGQVSASPVAQGNPQPAKLGTQVSANAGPGFTAKDVLRVENQTPAANEPTGAQATPDAQAQAVGADSNAAEPATGAGSAQVEANGVKAGDWVKPTVGNDTRPRQVDSVGSDGWVYTKSGDSFKPGQFEPTAQPVSTPITGGTGVAGNWEPPASQAPTKPAPGPASLGSAKADMDHLFGVDARRTKALERIAEGKAWFGNALKAGEFIAKNGLKGTHESVKTGDKHWDVRAKSEVQPVSQPQEQTNGTQAAQAQPQQTQPETGADTGISEPAAGTGVGGKAEGVEAKPATLKDAIAKVRAKKAAESQRLAPAQAQKLQEAHKANGPDVTLATVQRMYDRVMKSLITGKGSNGGTQYDIKPKERKELQAQADRLTNDLSLFGVQQEQPVGSGHTVENVAKAIQQKIASNRRKAQEKSRKEHEAKNWRPNSTPESEQAGYDAEVSAESREAHERSASALLGSDPVALIDMFVNGNFEASEDVFKEITGVRIRGLSAAGKKAALYKWANWTPEQIAQAEQDASDKWAARAEKFKQDDLKDAVRGAWMALDNLRVKTGDSEVTGQEYVTQTIASGFDQAHKQKNGVATIYGLTDGKRFTTLKAKPFTEFVKAAMAFGGLDKAMEYVNPPKLQAPAGFVDRSFDTASAKREPTEHAGLKIYPVNVKVGDKVEQKWGVQTLNNSEREKKGERQLGGDPLVDTLEGAKKLAEQEVEGAKRLEAYRAEMAALDDKKKEADAVAQAKKDANKGKSIAERRKDSILDGPTKLHPNAGLGTGTKREAMQKAVEQDRYIQSAMVRDEAAKKRDQESTERARRNNLPTGNINYPGVKEYFEAVARLKADDYTKPEYRVYDGRDTKGAFREISKTEYDYAQELKGKQSVAPADTAQAATETVAKPERQYHLVAINEKTGAKTFLTRTPVTHAEAVTMKGKYDDKPGRRIQLEDVTPVEPASNPLDVPTDAQTQSTDAVKVGRFDHIQVPDETTRWMGFDGRKTVKADLQALAQRHSEYYQTAQQVRDDIEFVLGNPDGWYIHKDNKVVLFRERMGVGAIPQARVEVEAEADSMSVRSVYIGGKRQIAKKMADKKSILSGLDLGGQSPESLTISEYLKALGNGSSRPTSPSDEALKVVDSLTTADPEVKTLTPADVAAAEKQAIGVLQAAIDKMKAQEAQRFAARFLPTMGVNVPVGKARINAAMTDPKINLLGAADALNVSFAKSIVDTLEAKQEGRVADVADPKKVEKPVAAPIGDFGQKIGGAKKDTWTGFKDDLSAVKDDEIAGRKLSEIWPAPDYQKLIDDGMDVHSVAIIRSLRDEIPAKPRNAYKLSRWADQVQTLRALATNIMNGKDTGPSIAGFLERGNGPSKGIAGRADLYMAVGHDKSLEGIRLAHRHYSLYRGRENVNLWVAERDSGATAFSNWPQELATGDTKEDAIAAFKARYAELDSVAAVKKASFDIITETGKKGFFIGKKIGRNIATLAGPFDTVQEARAYRQSNLAALDEKLAKYKEIPKDRRDTNEPRVGEDMRNGQDVTPEMFAEAFGFKGVEFGNWVEQKRRQKDLNDAYDALMDMAAIMGVPAKAISLNGELGLAFGARGSGGVNPAAAHYESDKIVINLTKREGAGSLGHEWWHAVDNYFSRMRGGQTSPFMTTATDVGLSARGSQYVAYPGVRKEMIDAFGEVVRSIRATAMKVRSSKMDAKRTKEYWTTGEEMAARAFESYLISKLQDQDASNDYLANVVDQKTWDAMAAMGMQNEDSYPYPTAGEMPTIRAGFDKFFQTLETKETEGGNVAMFSRPTFSRGAQSQANESVERLATGIASHWENAPKVVVAFDMNDPIIPESVRKEDQRQRSGGATGTPEGFYYKGTVYLMSSKLGTPNDIARVLFHESLGHYGLRGTFGKALRPILRDVAMLRRAEVDAKIKQYGLKMGNTLDRFTAAEEVLAELAQTKPEIGFVQRAIAAIRTWLRQNVPGFNNLRLTDDELIRNYILPARRYVEQGGGPKGGLPVRVEPTFSRGTNAAMTNNDVVGNQGGRSADDTTPGASFDAQAAFEKHGGTGDVDESTDIHAKSQAFADMVESEGWTVVGRGHKYITINKSFGETPDGYDKQASIKVRISDHSNVNRGHHFGEAEINIAPDDGYDRDTFEDALRKIRSAYVTDEIDTVIPNEPTAPDSGGAMFSRSLGETLTSATNSVRDVAASTGMGRIANKAVDVLNERMSHEGTIGLWHKTFGSMYQLAKSHPPFKRVFDAAQNFINDVSYYASESADLAPKLLPKLEDWRDLTKTAISPEDNKAIEAPIFEGTLSWARDESGKPVKVDVLIEAAEVRAGVVWTDAELKSMFNLTGEKQSDGTWTGQIGLYKEFRNAIDSSLDNTAKAEMLRFAGKDAAPLREIVLDAPDADTAAVLLRDHLLALAEDDPARSAALTDTANGVMDRADKVKQLKKEGYAPLSRFGQYSVDVVVEGEREYFGLFETKHAANQMAAKMRIAYGDENVSTGTMSDKEFQLFQGITPESMELFGNMLGLDATGDKSSDAVFQEYLKRTKNNRSAMKRLIRRKGIAGFSTDTGRVLASFIYSNARMTSAGLHMGELDKAVQDIPKGSGQLKDAAIELREYIKNPREEAQAMRGLLFAQYLGGNVASMLMNFMQVPTVSLPYLSQFGGVTKATGALVKAMKDQKSNMLEKGLQQALKAADEKGITQPQSVHELMAQSRGSATLKSGDGTRTGNALAHASNNLSKFSVGWGKLFGMAEQINRRSTFIAAYRLGVEHGVPDPAAFAEKAVNETQFINNKANKAKFARGAIGGTLMTFKSYSTNYLELLYRLSTQNGPEGKKAALLMLGMLFLMAGAGGMPGAEDAEDLIDGIGQRMGYNLSTKKAKEKFLEETFGKPMAQFIMSGISGLPGSPIDISGRAGLGNLFPGTGVFMPKASHANDLLEFGGPAAGMLKRFGEAVGHLSTGNVFEAAMAASPVAIANMRKGVDMLDSGMYKDAKGYKVMDTTTGEALAKIAGFQPKAVKDDSEDSYLRLRTKNFYNEYKQSVAARWANGMFESDPDQVQEAKDMIASWNEKNPELPMRPNMMAVAQRLKKMRETREERILKGAPKVMQASIRQEIAAEKSAQ